MAFLKFLAARPRTFTAEESADGVPTLILLHGYGADAKDLLPLVDRLDPRLLAISIQAPIELPFGGFAWYHLSQTLEGLSEDPASRGATEELLASELGSIINEAGGSRKNLFLLCFSQGCMMAYGLIARQRLGSAELPLRGFAPLSGYVPDDIQPLFKAGSLNGAHSLNGGHSLNGLPIFIGHGEYDDLVPVRGATIADRILTEAGASVTKRIYPIGHGISEEELADLSEWFAELLGPVPSDHR